MLGVVAGLGLALAAAVRKLYARPLIAADVIQSTPSLRAPTWDPLGLLNSQGPPAAEQLHGRWSLLARLAMAWHEAPPKTATHQRIAMAAVLGGQLKKVPIGSSGMEVTEVCLGTMTWGIQNTEEEAHEQLDYALKERGVNFIDIAEMYPVPSSDPRWVSGTTEAYVGTWLAKNAEWREKVIIATKVAGCIPAPSQIAANRTDPPSEPAPCRLDAASVKAACEGSLRRLQTSYIDLYQVHWPDRYVPIFGSSEYNPDMERESVPIKETLGALWDLIKAGKIKHYGLSNETTYGVAEWVKAADEMGAPRPVSIQNSFSLLGRTFATELAEACAPSNYNIGLLPWSPLGGGALSGKYLDGMPEGARFTLYENFQSRYLGPPATEATKKYKAIADKAGISLATLSLSWCMSRWYVASTIIGATTMDQLKEDIDAFTVTLTEDELKAIDKVHMEHKDPTVGL